jgi:hypothetical protein
MLKGMWVVISWKPELALRFLGSLAYADWDGDTAARRKALASREVIFPNRGSSSVTSE